LNGEESVAEELSVAQAVRLWGKAKDGMDKVIDLIVKEAESIERQVESKQGGEPMRR